MWHRTIAVAVLTAAALLIPLGSATGAGNEMLDPSFGSGGKATADFVGDADAAAAVVVQPDGKVVAAGYLVSPSTQYDFALARFGVDGSLDASFDGDGRAATSFGGYAGGADNAAALALQPDGKIVAVGQATTSWDRDFALARYLPDGTLDAGFDGDGRVMTNFSSPCGQPCAYDAAYAVALQPDGKIVAAGYQGISAAPTNAALARYNPDGSLDATFGSGGKVISDLGGSGEWLQAVKIQPDGKIVVAGSTNAGGAYRFVVVRYTASGALDPMFGTGGKVTTGFGGIDYAYGLDLQPDGKIVVAGETSAGAGHDFALARYLPDGTLDPAFGTAGKVTTDFGGNDESRAVITEPGGTVVVAGFTSLGGDMALARYLPNGTLDPAFGTNGKATTDFGSIDTAKALAEWNGRLVAAGSTGSGASLNFAVARYVQDTTPPVITSHRAPPPNAAGWNNGQVTVTWEVSDPDTPVVSTSGCDSATLSGETPAGGTTLTCTATSAGGTSWRSETVQIDETPPSIAFAGNHGEYTVDETVTIRADVGDGLSGVATEHCDEVNAPAYTLPLGGHVLGCNAVDRAGNSATASTQFTIRVDFDSLGMLVRTFSSSVDVANGLVDKLMAAKAAAARGNATAKENQLKAFRNQIAAQAGKALTATEAAVLTQFSLAL